MSKPVKLPSGAYRIRWLDADGKRQSATFGSFDLARSELRHRESEAEETAALRRRDPAAAITVAQGFARWRADDRRGPGDTERRHTLRWRRREHHFRVHIEPTLGPALLADLAPRRIKEWINVLASTPTHRPGEKNTPGRTLSAATIRAIVVTLSQLMKSNDVKPEILLPEAMKQKKRRSRPRAFQSIEDVRAFLGGCREPWFKVAAAIACYAGARLGEIASLRWHHIGESTITIALSWEGPLKARYENDDDAARVVPLDHELAAILEAWRKVTKAEPDDHVVVVGGDLRRPLRERFDDMALKTRSACKRAGLAPLTFHSLRASYATITADQGLPIGRLSALLGHNDAATTAIYIRPESEHAVTDPRARISGHVQATPSPAPPPLVN